MLILSRKASEGVRVGSNIVIRIEEVRGNRVRISFDAPRDIRIVREELEDLPPEPEPAKAA